MTAKNHIRRVDQMKHNPWIIGLEDIALSASESIIFNSGKLVREPDNLMFNPHEKTIYNVEYKSYNNQKNRKKAFQQLESCHNHLNYIFPDWKIVDLYISGDYNIRRI